MHIALIADGNGRWGIKHFGSRAKGHEEGAKALYRLLSDIPQGVSYLTFYGLSVDNIQKRPKDEVDWLYEVIGTNLEKALSIAEEKDIRLNFIGNGGLPDALRNGIQRAKQATRDNEGLVFTLALSYSGRDEIIRAATSLQALDIPISEESLGAALDTCGLPDVDMVVRTGGERRLSGFLIWQSSYAELFFSDTLFPDFTSVELRAMIAEYHKRERRFGGLKC